MTKAISRKTAWTLCDLSQEKPKLFHVLCQNRRIPTYFSTVEQAEQFGVGMEEAGVDMSSYEITATCSAHPLKGLWDITPDELLTPKLISGMKKDG